MKLAYQDIDRSNMFEQLYNFTQQLQEAMTIGQKIELPDYQTINHIIFAGMGGSGIAGDLASLLAYETAPIPFTVIRDYTLPHWANQYTLVICISYSGNTQEIISILHGAMQKQTHIIGITSGGLLKKILFENNYPTIIIPQGYPPRVALGYLTIPLLYILHKLKLIPHSFEADLLVTIQKLDHVRDTWSLPTAENNPAMQVAQQIYKTFPLFYGEAQKTTIIARRWRSQCAENSKMLAGMHELPELNHNEIVGWKNNPELLKHISVIWLLDDTADERIAKRVELSQAIIKNHAATQITVHAQGKSAIERAFYLIYLGDWVSYWCAILHHEDPTPVATIETLKKLLQK